jgi:hypothetical protein
MRALGDGDDNPRLLVRPFRYAPVAEQCRVPAYQWADRNICLGALCVFGFVYALNIVIGLFHETPVGRPRITELLGPVAMLSIPVALLAGLVWLWAVNAGRRAGRS